MKRILAALLVLIMTVAALSACGSAPLGVQAPTPGATSSTNADQTQGESSTNENQSGIMFTDKFPFGLTQPEETIPQETEPVDVEIPVSALRFELTQEYYTITGIEASTYVGNVLNIPSAYRGLPVASIGVEAFRNCTWVTKVTIPSSVTEIDYDAFSGCTALKDIVIHDDTTIIEPNMFADTAYYKNESNWENGLLYIGTHLIKAKEDLTGEVEIKSGTKNVANYAFEGSKVSRVIFPDSVTRIGDYAFKDCNELTNIEFSENSNLLSIGKEAFTNFAERTSITIPASVRIIEEGAFASCSNLTNVKFENKNGWQATRDDYFEKTIVSISSSDLKFSVQAADCLKNTYGTYKWTRS